MSFEGMTALVTGASRGIGRALVEELAKRPMKTVLAGVRDPSNFAPIPGALAEVRPVRLEMSSYDAIEECLADISGDIAELDMLINNAGMMTGGLLEEQDTRAMYALFQVNLVGAAHLIQRVLPGMLKRSRGRIVNNASIGAYAVFPAVSTYSASKTALVALTVALNRELRGTGVTAAHLVTPSVDTDLLDATEAIFSRYMDTSRWQRMSPRDWAEQVVDALERGETTVLPEGASAINTLVRREGVFPIDPLSDRTFNRTPRP
jgi:short-subunit dehydrogenase